MLYSCDEVGSIPLESERCTDGVCSVNPGQDNCGTISGTPNCYCNDTITICGSKIDPSCSTLLKADVDPKATYTCSGEGQIPQKAQVCSDVQYCQDLPTNAQCKSLCNCTGTDAKCSKDFDPICRLPQGIYKCNEAGQPEKVQVCNSPEVCFEASTGLECGLPECICEDGNARCGSTFPAACDLHNNTLYTCTQGSLPNATQDCSPGICSGNIKSDVAASLHATAGDTCIDLCACKTANNTVSVLYTERSFLKKRAVHPNSYRCYKFRLRSVLRLLTHHADTTTRL